MLYEWKNGARIALNAQVSGEEIERIAAEKKGRVGPDDIVQAAMAKKNPLHPFFEWNDGAAAEAYRRVQAGMLLRSITVVHVEVDKTGNKTKQTIRAFVVASQRDHEETRKYEPISVVLKTPEKRAALLATWLREIEELTRRYRSIEEFEKIFEAIDATKKHLARRRPDDDQPGVVA